MRRTVISILLSTRHASRYLASTSAGLMRMEPLESSNQSKEKRGFTHVSGTPPSGKSNVEENASLPVIEKGHEYGVSKQVN